MRCPNGYTGDGQKCRGIQFDHHLLMLDVNVCLAFVQNVITQVGWVRPLWFVLWFFSKARHATFETGKH